MRLPRRAREQQIDQYWILRLGDIGHADAALEDGLRPHRLALARAAVSEMDVDLGRVRLKVDDARGDNPELVACSPHI